MGDLQEYYMGLQIKLDLRNYDLRKKRDLWKIVPTTIVLVNKLLDL